MKTSLLKMRFRQIFRHFDRYIAMVLILALGVGFFAGYKEAKPALLNMAQNYYKDYNLHDYQAYSPIGFNKDAATALEESSELVKDAEGAMSVDFVYGYSGQERQNKQVLRAYSLPQDIDKIMLVEGRLPEAENEIALDSKRFSSNWIGQELTVADLNSEEVTGMLTSSSYEVVGRVDSPRYVNYERGSSAQGNGEVRGFAYLPESAFTIDYYTELDIRVTDDAQAYSDAYDNEIEAARDELEGLCQEQVDARYSDIQKTQAETLAAAATAALTAAQNGTTPEQTETTTTGQGGTQGTAEPKASLVDRNAIFGYLNFGIDVQIVENMANIFPWFFFLAAAMVCATIMIRLVDEQRFQMGVILALGYRRRHVYRNYLTYALAAFIIGWPLGYFLGTFLFPRAVWMAYSILYIFPGVSVSFDLIVAGLSLVVALLCALGSAGLCCWTELRNPVSSLMHRKAPKAGARTMLERFPKLFNHIAPGLAMALRNIFRYKIKSVMIVLGVCCCTAALLAGLGTRDSIRNISHYQFEEIHVYDYQVDFQTEVDKDAFSQALEETRPDAKVLFASKRKATLAFNDEQKTTQAIGIEEPQDKENENFISLHLGDEELRWPGDGRAVLSNKLAQSLGVQVGDIVFLSPDATSDEKLKLEVTGIADNYLDSYVYFSLGSYAKQKIDTPALATAFVNVPPGGDDYQTLADFSNIDNVARVQSAAQQQEVFAKEMGSFDLVVMLIVCCAGLLVLIVLQTLMSINVIERTGEIATVQALGMRPKQAVSHVFRENILLIALGIILGLLAGIVVHRVVLSNIDIDAVYFNMVIEPISFIFTAILAIVFSLIAFFFSSIKVRRINIAQSLGSVD